ncbi:hypothetical protein EFA46_009815 [Halarchaeum sp. CBA1220]|uniref:hypothetical protein n=1 Tax=Halarchaeum sp. CBA1220 TaxID=1853682 RepID=UPI000F3A805A|nr:hypothetical protein [Halarchaeum sp. CBA1220]QLC34489.1 hypothetical protein EFA46_009815 [Halarchaeum sp. CBA1220]
MSEPPHEPAVTPVSPDGPGDDPPPVTRAVGVDTARYVELAGAGDDAAFLVCRRVRAEAGDSHPRLPDRLAARPAVAAALAYLGDGVVTVRVRTTPTDASALVADASLPRTYEYEGEALRFDVARPT